MDNSAHRRIRNDMENGIKEPLLRWYEINKRELPWRLTKNPYKIWVSEVILQQTRVVYGLDYYRRFLEKFPDIKTLAEASNDEVMRSWQGLGYYRRAAHLHQAAQFIMEHHKGIFPTTYAEVAKLKGVGTYTAAAICSIAYNLPYAVVDGNVYRVLARLFGVDLPIDSGRGQRYFAELADSLLDRAQAGEYNQAMMDFGTLQCTPQSPSCDTCPFRSRCVAFLTNSVELYPIKEKRTKVRNRYFNYIQIHCNGKTLLKKRKEKDIWHNLYEFPMIESNCEMDYHALSATTEFGQLTVGIKKIRLINSTKMAKHQLSHQSIYATFHEMEWDALPQLDETITIAETELTDYAISRLTESYLERDSK